MDMVERLNDHQEATRAALNGLQSQMWTALPGVIVAVDLVAMTVQVQPTVQALFTDPNGAQSYVTLPVLPDVPIVFPGGGGYRLTFPVRNGDECLVVFSSRAIDNWWQSGDVQPTTDRRMHDLSDGFAIIGPMSQVKKIGGVSTTTTVLRSDDASVEVEIDQTNKKVNVKAPTEIVLDAPLVTITGVVNVENRQNAARVGTFVGSINVTDTVTATNEVVGGGKSLVHHVHTGVQSGGGVSGPPQ